FVKYAQGSPLALIVLGSNLYQKSRADWEKKNIFLDIAILFEGTSEKDVKEFLSCCYKGVVCGISNLIDKYLLVRSYFGLIDMHDMLQEMGKDIVRQESMDPGRHSRLWKAKDVYQGMINLRVIFFYDPKRFWVKRPTEKLFADQVDSSLVNLREIYVPDCKKLRKIPSLLGVINLEILHCRRCESLLELPCLNHLASLKELGLRGCHNLKQFPEVNILSSNISKLESLRHLNLSHCPMIEFPEIPRSLRELDLSGTQIKEATLSLDSLNNLQELKMSFSSIQKLQCNIILFGSREISTVDVSSPILISETIDRLEMDHCESLKLLSELPPYMRNLDARGCTSLEKVSFTDQISYHLDPNDDDDDDDWFLMIFCNCISLNQDSIENIEANTMLKIGYIAEKQRVIWDGGDYETFRSQWKSFLNEDSNWRYMGDHVLILFSKDMVKQDKDYEEASFEFYIQNLPSSSEEDEEDEEETEDENIKVEKCGVHVSYVDEETSTTPTT
ncbi:hypothetical protein Gogos_003992, partial [Gossypium gossypioides]|nr:hypothetical protein [Gossypium gossypioides]